MGDMMLDCLFAELTTNSGYPEVVCQFCQLQLNVFYEFKRKVFEQHAKFTKFIEEQNEEDRLKAAKLISPVPSDDEDAEIVYEVKSCLSNKVVDEELLIQIDSCHSIDDLDKHSESDMAITKGSQKFAEEIKLSEHSFLVEEQFLENSEVTNNIVIESNYELRDLDDDVEFPKHDEFDNSDQERSDQCEDDIAVEMLEEFIDDDFSDLANTPTHCRSDSKLANVYDCRICLIRLPTREGLKQHLANAHHNDQHAGVIYNESSPTIIFKKYQPPKPGQTFSCLICHKEFTTQAQCKSHEFRHTNIRPLKCEICDKSFKLKCDLRIHMDCHNNVRKYGCDICGKSFRMISHLNNHRETHNAVNTIECKMCDMLFKTSITLKCHVRQVHGTDHDFKCNICDRTFYRSNKLLRHMQGHSNKANKLLRSMTK